MNLPFASSCVTRARAREDQAENDRRHPFRPFADRLFAYRRRATALFNWLYARGRGGKMLLRIEDTDRERSTQAAIDAILDGLGWLGIPGMATPSISSRVRRGTGKSPNSFSRRATPIAAMRPRMSSRKCARQQGARAAPGSMTGAGATAIRRKRPQT